MDDIQLLAAIESYLAGEMNPQEQAFFEALRKKTPEIDQMVVEHNMFLHQMDSYVAYQNIKHTLHHVHQELVETGDLYEGGEVSTKVQVVQLWNRYKRVAAIAASVGGVIALVISGLVAFFSPVNGNQLQQLSKDIEIIKRNQQVQGSLINEVKTKIPTGVKMAGHLLRPMKCIQMTEYLNVRIFFILRLRKIQTSIHVMLIIQYVGSLTVSP